MAATVQGFRLARSPVGQPKLLDRVRAAIRTRHDSLRTEDAQVGCMRGFILFHGRRHAAEMTEAPHTAAFVATYLLGDGYDIQ
ncbi:MAG: hypothetical protein AB1898_31285, partial [Acidobacteriota bacterium]